MHDKHQSDTKLLNVLWIIKNNKYTPNAMGEILGKQKPYNHNTKKFSLCLNEKIEIVRYKG